MSNSYQTYNPECEVTLHKTIGRKTVDGQTAASTRFRGTQQNVDLTPWLDDSGSVRTTKSVRSPSGGFSFTLTDRMDDAAGDSMYGLIEPMDLVTIRMARSPASARNSTSDSALPVIMRGFVSRIDLAERMSEEGEPSRQIVITGEDYGKLWRIFQIFYAYNYPMGPQILSQWKFFEKYGTGFNNESAAEFIKNCITKVLNPFITQIREHNQAPGASAVVPVTVDDADVTVDNGMVSPFGINQWQGGTLYSAMSMFGDVGPWNEMFLEDRQTTVNLVYRPNPFFDAEDNPIVASTNPTMVPVDASELTEISVSRSDSDVANYYWVDSPRSNLVYGPNLKLAAASSAISGGGPGDFYIRSHGNCDPSLYGVRKMTVQTNEGNPQEVGGVGGAPEGVHQASMQYSDNWINDRRATIVKQNWDNVVFEKGSMTLRGNDQIKAGVYIELTRGTITSRYYVVSAEHVFVPYKGYWTRVTVERGTGFIKRIERGSGQQSPWLSELAKK